MNGNMERMMHFHEMEDESEVVKLVPGFYITVGTDRRYFETVPGKFKTAMFLFYLTHRFTEVPLRRSVTVRLVIEKLYEKNLVNGAKNHTTIPEEDTPHLALILLLMQGEVIIELEALPE